MKNTLTHNKTAHQIFAALGKDESTARFVGGAVRDALLGMESPDVDIATALPPPEVMKRLEAASIKSIPTGIKHGTITAIIGKNKFEITTLRKDVETDGRHAKVRFTDSWEEDAARRDFTINALSLSLGGKLFDYFGGIADLKKNKVRFIGDAEERIREDYLRILRFFRFYARFGKGTPDAKAIAACTKLKDGIAKLSGERIQQEMMKLLECESPITALSAMEKCGVLAEVLPAANLARLRKYIAEEKNGRANARTSERSERSLRGARGAKPLSAKNINPLARLAALSKDSKFAARWKLSGAQEKYISDVHKCLAALKPDEKTAKKLIRKYGNEIFKTTILISGKKSNLLNWQPPVFPVSGSDLIKLGFAPGKSLGDTLKKLEQKWEESDYKLSKKQLLKI